MAAHVLQSIHNTNNFPLCRRVFARPACQDVIAGVGSAPCERRTWKGIIWQGLECHVPLSFLSEFVMSLMPPFKLDSTHLFNVLLPMIDHPRMEVGPIADPRELRDLARRPREIHDWSGEASACLVVGP